MADTEDEYYSETGDAITSRTDAIANLLVAADAVADPELRAAALKTVDIVHETMKRKTKPAEVVTFLGKAAAKGPFGQEGGEG